MIVERLTECFYVAGTVWHGAVAPENFSREGALKRRSDVRFSVLMLDRDGDLSSSRQGDWPQGRKQRGGVRRLPLASRLRDERIDRVQDFSGKRGVSIPRCCCRRTHPNNFAYRGMVTPLCSTALFLEYEAVLSRPETRQATGHSLEDVASVMSALAAIAEGVDISFRTRPMLSDVADEMVLEAALNRQAEAIVTHNVKDLRPALGLGVTVITPGEIVRRLNT